MPTCDCGTTYYNLDYPDDTSDIYAPSQCKGSCRWTVQSDLSGYYVHVEFLGFELDSSEGNFLDVIDVFGSHDVIEHCEYDSCSPALSTGTALQLFMNLDSGGRPGDGFTARFTLVQSATTLPYYKSTPYWMRTTAYWQRTTPWYGRTTQYWQRTTPMWRRTTFYWQKTSPFWVKTLSPEPDYPDYDDSDIPPGELIGIIFGGLAGLAIFLTILFACMRTRKSPQRTSVRVGYRAPGRNGTEQIYQVNAPNPSNALFEQPPPSYDVAISMASTSSPTNSASSASPDSSPSPS